MGRAEADITKWIKYFVEGMAYSFEQVIKRMETASMKGDHDRSQFLRKLDPRQRRALEPFKEYEIFTARQIAQLFGFKPRTGAALCKKWVEDEFLVIVDSSNRGRSDRLSPNLS